MWSKIKYCTYEVLRRIRPRQALVFLTHVESDRVLAHYERLRRETKGLFDCFLCVHESVPHTRAKRILPPDIHLRPKHAERYAKARYDEMLSARRSFIGGYTDLSFMPALVKKRFRPYRYVWLLEYDVDYAGNWGDFFTSTMGSGADFLSTTLVPRAQSPDWYHWPTFRGPPDLPFEMQMRSYAPIARFSQAFLFHYREAMKSDRWRGHSEALYPTVALYAGLTTEDLGRDRHYRNTPAGRLTPGTFVYRPPVSTAYFHERPENFSERNMLYHPVKLAEPSQN